MRTSHVRFSFAFAAVALSLLAAGCGQRSSDDGVPLRVQSALFTNGGFETDAIGVVPSGWTITPGLNTGITDTRPAPQTLASLMLGVGGLLETHVVGGVQESQIDPDLGATASLRFPKYGLRAAVVNYKDATDKGFNHNANMLSQLMTAANGDVDPSDGKVHVRFAIAPVLQSGGHPYTQQPYYYIELDDVTKGTILYQDFNASAEAGVPWKIGGAALDTYYTDWQLVDIAPGNAGLAVGDQVKLVVVAAGCYATAHFGRVYIDGVGSTIPGLYTFATGPQSVNQGTDITYVVTYKNGGTTTATAAQLAFVIPAGTTYKTNSLPTACAGVAAGATGTLSCTLGTLAAGASGSFTVTVTANPATSGTIVTNGNYSIFATGVSALLGPKVLTTITANVVYADVSLVKTDGVAAVGWGQATSYTIAVANAGPGAATTVTVSDTLPAQLTGVTWTCAGSGGGTCTASGSGSLATTASLPVGASVLYTLTGAVIAGTGTGTVINTATATLGGGAIDPDTSNNTSVDTDSIGVLRTLTLTKTNANGGTVTTAPASIACGTTCTGASGTFVDGAQVVLTASPVSGAAFTTWGGACASAGVASTCTLTMAGDQTVTAAFTPPPTVNITTGDHQGGARGAAFVTPLQVRVLDSLGNPLVGVTVVFTPPASGASLTLSAATAITNATGFASVTATANNTAGAYAVTASLSGTPIAASFSLWNYGAATSLTVVSGGGQSATVGVAFGAALVVALADAAGQPVPGVSVAFTAPVTGARAALSAAAVTTGPLGQASVTATAGQVSGTYLVTARLDAATSGTFGLTNVPGAPATIVVTSGGGQLTLVSTPFAAPLVATVRDVFSNLVPGALVTFTAPASGASAAAAAASTTAAGQVSVVATANATLGSYAVTAASGAATGASFALTNFGLLVLAPASGNVAPRGALGFSASGDPAAIYTYTFATNASGGTLGGATGAYHAGATGNVTDVVRVTDSLERSVTANVVVSAALSLSPGAPTVAPRAARSFTASGGSGLGVTFALTTNASGGSVDPASGAYVAGATGGVTDVVTATDSLGNTAAATISVSAAVSLAPATASLAPQASVKLTAAGGGGPYVYAITVNHSGGTVDAAGNYTAGATGSVSDVVTATDVLGNTASSTLTVGPVVTLTASGTTAPPRGTLTFSATNGGGAGYVFSLGLNASGATINATTGAYVAGATPSVTDTILVTDALGNIATANVAVGAGVSLTPLTPTAPTRGAVHLVATGGSGTGFAFALTTNASGATVDAATGLYTAGALGTTVDVVTVTDSLGNTASVAVSVGGGLTINPASPTVAPREALTFTTAGGSGTGLVFALATNGSGASLGAATGLYTAGALGTTVDVVTVTDSLGNVATATIHVGPVLSLAPAALSLAPLGQQTFAVSGGSGTGYVLTLTTNASNGSVHPTTGAYVAGPTGGVADVVTVVDSLGNTASATITVTAALQALTSAFTVAPRATQTLIVTGGAGGYSFALTNNGSGGSVDPVTGVYVAGATGATSDLITVTDDNGAITTITVTIGPGISLSPAAPAVAPAGALVFVATGGTLAGTGYLYSLAFNRSGGTINPQSGAYQAGPVGNVVDVVEVTDGLGNTARASVAVGGGLAVNPAAPAPAPRATLTFTVTGGSGLGYTFALTSNASGATLDPATGVYRAGALPSVTDTVTVTDSLGNKATVIVSVGPGMMVTPVSSTTAPRGTVVLSASGGSGTGYTFALTTNASNGSVDPTSGRYVAGSVPGVTDTVTVTDSLGNSDTATILVGPGLTLTAPSVTTPPRGSLALVASGGSGNDTFAVETNGSGATVVSTTGVYTAGDAPNVNDVVEVTDDLGNTATIQIAVGAGVTITPAAPATPPGSSLTFHGAGGSGVGFGFALTTNGSGGTIDASTGVYTAGAAVSTTDVVTVSDSLGNLAHVSVSVGNALTLNPPAPTAAPRAKVPLTASGGSGAGYVFSFVTNASGGSLDAVTGLYTAGRTPNVTDTVKVVDSLGGSATVAIAVSAGVTLSPATSSVAPQGRVAFLVSGGSGAGYQFTVVTNGSGALIDAALGTYRAGGVASTTDVVSVTDSLGNGATATVSVGLGLSPSPANATVPPRGTLQLTVTGGAAAYTFAVTTNASGATVNSSTGLYTAGAAGSTQDVVTVGDANGVTKTVTIQVGPGVSITPEAPVVSAGGTIPFTAAGGSGSGFTWRIAAAGSGGTIDATTGLYTAAPSPTVGGVDVVEVVDPLGNSAQVSVGVAVHTISASGGHGLGCAVAGRDSPWLSAGALGLLAAAFFTRRRARAARRRRQSAGARCSKWAAGRATDRR